MIRLKIILLLFLFSDSIYGKSLPENAADRNRSGHSIKKDILLNNAIESRFSIKIAPLPLIDLYSGSSYRIGTEFKVYKNAALYLEGGSYFPRFNGLTNVHGYTAKAEAKVYLNRQQKTGGTYVSLEYFYKQQSYDWGDSIKLTPAYYKKYNLNKHINCVTAKFGVQYVYFNRIIVDVFAGIGVRYKNVKSTLNQNEVGHLNTGDSMSEPFMDETGKLWRPNFDVGVKVGLLIK